ncbi:MAG: peptidylprolyl isomerase [Myxococcales bacterium]
MPKLLRRFQVVGLTLPLTLAACVDLTAPGNGAPPPEPEPSAAPAQAEPAPAPPTPAPAPTAAEEQIGTSHLLVQYKGSERADKSITRSKDEARKLANEALAKAKKGQDFAAVVGQYSDEPGAKARGGALPKFGRGSAFDQTFKDAAFKLKPGELSPVVETKFGFHVIKRTE